jgi:hypothetical protein
LANNSRPDIAFVCSTLCRYLDRPAMIHYQTAKRVLRFVKGTINSKLVYKRTNEKDLITYADADHANCKISYKSISGICSLISGSLVSWASFKQQRVCTSTCESEILSSLDGVNECEFIYNVLKELDVVKHFNVPFILYNDNKSSNTTVESGGQFKSNKHYRVRVNRIRRAV